MKRKFVQILAFMLAFILFISCPLSVYASEKWEGSLGLTLYYNKDKILKYIKDTGEFWLYGATQAGAIVQHDFVSFAENKKKMDEILNEGDKIGVYINENDEAKGFYFSKEFMVELKAILDDYAKDNEPYYIIHIPSYKEVNPSQFATKGQYLTICNLAKKYGLIGVNGLYMSDLSEVLNGNYSYVNDLGTLTEESLLNDFVIRIYDNSWDTYEGGQRYKFDFPAGTSVGFESIEDGEKTVYSSYIDFHSDIMPDYVQRHNGTVLNTGTPLYTYEHIRACLISRDGFRERIYKSLNDFKNYSVGNRKVYYTKDYYDYKPEDISVSIDDLKKSVDELQKIIDELLKKIDDLTSESDIEDILRQILEALRNQQSSGGGGGSGGGDVTVNVDLSTTNNWLSKIYSKVSQIFEKMDSTIDNAKQSALDKIQESLDEIIKQLKAIKGWTIADTIIDGVDAIADWADFIKDIFTDADSGVSAISSTMDGAANLLKTKFPFCIPWDVYFLITFLAHEPETPVFSLPIKFERLGIEEYIEIDMSQFKVVSDISRTLLTLIYCYALLNLTMKIFPMTKEET